MDVGAVGGPDGPDGANPTGCMYLVLQKKIKLGIVKLYVPWYKVDEVLIHYREFIYSVFECIKVNIGRKEGK